MAEVFISYSKGNASPFVKKIGDALENAGISCWYMEKDSLYGLYSDAIPTAIQECRVFLVVLNERSNQSKDVLSEVSIAFKSDKAILPFNLDNCKLSNRLLYHLTAFTMVSANPSLEKSVQDLVKLIADILGKDPPQPQPTPAKIIKRGECGRNVTYELDENGVLTISGEGPMWGNEVSRSLEYGDWSNTPWWNERKTISYVRILSGVTSIGENAFFDCERLANVEIPDSVTSIDYGAFGGCTELASVNIPNSVISIEHRVFSRCTGLTSVTISDSVTSIGNCAFDNCVSLANVNIPDSVTSIGSYAFYGCTELKSVIVPAEVKIYDSAFPCTTKVIRRPPQK